MLSSNSTLSTFVTGVLPSKNAESSITSSASAPNAGYSLRKRKPVLYLENNDDPVDSDDEIMIPVKVCCLNFVLTRITKPSLEEKDKTAST